MKRYELVKEYPGSPRVDTQVEWVEDIGLYSDENGVFVYAADIIENYPEFWKDVNRDKRTMVEKVRDFLDSPEGEAALDRFGERLEASERQAKRDLERFERMVEHTGLEELMDKIVQKYNSDEYVRKEMKLGYQPREDLSYLAYSYFSENGEETEEGTNPFMDWTYKIGNYLVGMMVGQGSVVKIQKI